MSNSENAIEVTNLVKRYKDLLALDHFSLTVICMRISHWGDCRRDSLTAL